MRAPDLQPIAAGAAALLLVASMGWWLLSAPEVIESGQPSWKGADIVRLTASVPQIDHFEQFYVNDDNPFVPLSARLAENIIRQRLRDGPIVVKPPPRPVQVLPPRQPVIVLVPENPKLVLPKLSPTPANAPVVYALVAADGQEALTVRMPGAKDSIRLVPGEKVDGWTLVSINNGNLAIFTDPQGLEHQFVIGQGDLAVAQNEGGTAAPGADPNAGKAPGGRGMIPKAPGSTRPPGPGGADGAIPKPPPREERRRPPKDMPKDPQGNPVVPVPVPPKK